MEKSDVELIAEGKDPKSRYYDAGGIEVTDIIKAKLTPEQFKGFLLGNIIKYSCRANFKKAFDRDIEKVGNYQKQIDFLSSAPSPEAPQEAPCGDGHLCANAVKCCKVCTVGELWSHFKLWGPVE